MLPLSLPHSPQGDHAKPKQPVSVLVMTQHQQFANRLAQSLGHHSYAVSTADGLPHITPLLQQKRIHIMLLDWFDGHSSLSLCKQVRLMNQEVYVVLLLPPTDALRHRIKALDAGADDCLVKPLCLEELQARIRAYCRRIGNSDTDIYRFADLTLDRQTREVYRGNHLISLTAKEFDLLKYLLRHQQQVMTRDQILEHVWGYDFAGDSNIIEVYIRYLRLKLEAHNPRRLIHTVRYVGYVLREINDGQSRAV